MATINLLSLPLPFQGLRTPALIEAINSCFLTGLR